MKILHILNDGPSETAERIIDAQSNRDGHDIEVVDLSSGEVSYPALVSKIEGCDHVVSWNRCPE